MEFSRGFYGGRAWFFVLAMVISLVWFTALCIFLFKLYDRADKTQRNLVGVLAFANAVTPIVLPALLIFKFRPWLDAARLACLLIVHGGPAILIAAWNSSFVCPTDASQNKQCKDIGLVILICSWVVPAILVSYSIFLLVAYRIRREEETLLPDLSPPKPKRDPADLPMMPPPVPPPTRPHMRPHMRPHPYRRVSDFFFRRSPPRPRFPNPRGIPPQRSEKSLAPPSQSSLRPFNPRRPSVGAESSRSLSVYSVATTMRSLSDLPRSPPLQEPLPPFAPQEPLPPLPAHLLAPQRAAPSLPPLSPSYERPTQQLTQQQSYQSGRSIDPFNIIAAYEHMSPRSSMPSRPGSHAAPPPPQTFMPQSIVVDDNSAYAYDSPRESRRTSRRLSKPAPWPAT